MREHRVSADGRLELWADTRLDRPADILSLYERWGERTPEQLSGDFAFAIVDHRERRTFCARDAFGVKPFYYRSGRFAFAFSAAELLAVPDTERAIDPDGMADFLLWDEEDCERTVYRSVRRLPPAQWMRFEADGRTERGVWWRLDPSRRAAKAAEREYCARFYELFSRSVERRMPQEGAAGALLSGGLDSSSIAAVAGGWAARKGQKLHSFSTVYERVPSADERPYIRAVAAHGGFIAHEIAGDAIALFPGPGLCFPDTHELSMLYAGHYPCARLHNVRVLLDGDGGDEVVHRGYGRLSELLRRGRFVEYARTLVRLRRLSGRSYADLVKTRSFRPLVPAAVLGVWRALRWGRRALWFDRSLYSAEFARQADLGAREARQLHRELHPPRTVEEAHARELSPGPAAHAFETKYELARPFGIEHRYPFYDRELAEFCLSLPSELKMNNGWTKYVLRRAMAGVLPETVRWRGGKSYLSEDLVYRLYGQERHRIERALFEDDEELAPFYRIDTLRKYYRHFQYERRFSYAIILWQAVILSEWLKASGESRCPNPSPTRSAIASPV